MNLNLTFTLNKVVKTLIGYDLFLLLGWGLITPILAIFITDHIKGGDVRVAGIAIGIYWLTKSVIQIPVARYLDKNHGEKDDFYALVGGTFLTSLVPLGFIVISLPWHMYILQIVHAAGMALVIPSWSGIFTRHIDKGQEAFSWTMDSSAFSIGTGVAGIVGGTLAKILGFVPLFIAVSFLGLLAAGLCFLIKDEIVPKGPTERIYPIPKP